jgi:1-deoxy-D-xylulose-5-phosphate synthase
VALLGLGTRLGDCLKAADALALKGIGCSVADARFAKPLDLQLIDQLSATHDALITIDESAGAFGSAALQYLASTTRLDRGLKVRTLSMPDVFLEQASPEEQIQSAGLSDWQIVATALKALDVGAERTSARLR